MATGLIDIMKRAAMDANENSKPCDLRYGTVTSESPLKVQITNQFILPESILIVPEHLTDHEIKVTTTGYGWEDVSGDEINKSEQKIKVHGALKSGDKVALIRQSGGQFYYILDRLPKG